MSEQPTHEGPDPTHGGLTTHRGTRENCSGPDCGPTDEQRLTVDSITSDALDALYDRAEGAEAARDRLLRSRDRQAARAKQAQARVTELEAEVTRLTAELTDADGEYDALYDQTAPPATA